MFPFLKNNKRIFFLIIILQLTLILSQFQQNPQNQQNPQGQQFPQNQQGQQGQQIQQGEQMQQNQQIQQAQPMQQEQQEEKCYSIKNCGTCPELDFCERCESGFIMNYYKTKCNKGTNSYTAPVSRPISAQNNLLHRNKDNNPFQNVPISSLQKFKEKDLNNEIINKILIFILIILVLSIISSIIYNLVKKRMGGGYVEDAQDESAKVVYIR